MLLNYGSSLQVAVHYMRPNHLQSIPKQVLEPYDLFLRKKMYALYAIKFILTSYDAVGQEKGIQLPATADTLFRAEFTTTLRPQLTIQCVLGVKGPGHEFDHVPLSTA